MPVIGHAFVGVGTAILTHPKDRAQTPHARRGASLWVPALLVLAYLPDLVSQITLVTGWEQARAFGHSLGFALLATIILGPLLARFTGESTTRGLMVVLGSVLGHILLDILQSSDRTPFWPFSTRVVGPARELIPDRMVWEGLLFGAAFALVVGWRWAQSGENPLYLIDDPREDPAYRRRLRMGWFLAFAFSLAVVGLNMVKNLREKQMSEAARLVEKERYDEGLALLEEAQKWPARPRPGRVDYLKAEAAMGMGKRPEAEDFYLRSYAADPSYFWLVGDLAVFYAEGPEPRSERQRKAAPYVERLKTEFVDMRELPGMLTRIERKLSQGAGNPRTESHHGH